MAQSQAFAQPNKGTLMPGQTISVNKYTVQVERYLSQGGFAHVYLVRTATPVFNTTHHVLKRIAVPNEAMLTEVKKEVDIMRILRGHPNIVYLIDAAWHRMANGTYEVFILMEFCAGGGIIDMMNRRLRERLSEPEILNIFVDVCEGLAAMHALKPPLLHRDLKVENILQASTTSYKLCDFGSATPVQKIPSTSQEVRMLEADLNRHTTLQYRAPEMVDVHLRRPIDEKSDVWALGVLLYKLCYYTTPFEEHGPLAILNVQYKIPPYPMYSSQMNNLIASMLREHGAQRPTVFEILNHVHALRGTNSRYNYSIPPKQPPLSPRAAQSPLQALSPNIASPASPVANPLDELLSFKSRSQPPPVAARNAGIEARDKVLDAIAPMRRGRPIHVSVSPPPSPKKERGLPPLGAELKFGADGDKAWSGVRGHKSGMASIGGGSTSANLLSTGGTDAWGLSKRDKEDGKEKEDRGPGFESDFSSFGQGFGDMFQPAKSPIPLSQPQAIPISRPSPSPNIITPSGSPSKRVPTSRSQPRDAFEGLGISTQPPPRTLGEARKTRTGLVSLGLQSSGQYLNTPSGGQIAGSLGTSNTTYRPPSTHSPIPSSSRPQAPPSPKPQFDSWRSSHRKMASASELSAEERFPSLEDLDRKFSSPSPVPMTHAFTQPSSSERKVPSRPSSRAAGGPRSNNLLSVNGDGAGPATSPIAARRFDGVKSQHVTGTAMRESRMAASRRSSTTWDRPIGDYVSGKDKNNEHPMRSGLSPRPSFTRKHRSSANIKPVTQVDSTDLSSRGAGPSGSNDAPPALPSRPSPSPNHTPRDWLTGASDEEGAAAQPVLRESPSKRASFIERSPVMLQKPLEAENVAAAQGWSTQDAQRDREREKERERAKEAEKQREKEIRGEERERARELEREKSKQREREREKERQRAREKEREQARIRSSPSKAAKAFITRTGTGSQALQLPPVDTKLASQRSNAPSPSGLTDNWSPVVSSSRRLPKPGLSSSSSEDGPEEVNGYTPKGGTREKLKELSKLKDDLVDAKGKDSPSRRKRTKSKSRQSSVHDLVDLWGGGLEEDAPKDGTASGPISADNRLSVIMSSSKPPPLLKQPRSTSPSPPVDTALSTTPSRLIPNRPPSSQHHRKELNKPPSGARALPAPVPTPASGRSRPQSMFLNPVSKTTSLETNISSTPYSPSPNQQQQALSPPAGDLRSRRTTRRSSISDIVQRYEIINVGGKPSPSPSAAAAPLSLKVAASTTSTSAGVPSPGAAALRFPKLSPTPSPKVSKANLAVPEDNAGYTQRDSSKGRTSPTPSFGGLPSRTSPSITHSKPSETAIGVAVDGLPRRQSPFEQNKSSPAPPLQEPQPLRKATTPPEEPSLRSPSPEKPFQGVSKLIDRWQRAVDDSVEPRGFATRKVGAVGSLSGRGR